MNTTLILDFLKELKYNNNKEWMDANRDVYQNAKKEFEVLVNFLIMEIQQFDESVRGITPKDCIFRLNRDIRFSKDKSPYKINFGAFISEEGRKSYQPGYYFHLQPENESIIAGGIYMPPGDILKKVRQEVDYNPQDLKAIVTDKNFEKEYGKIQGEKLKTAPKGYSPDHPNIDFLKLKSYLAIHHYDDDEVKSEKFLEKVVNAYRILYPFNHYLSVAIS